MKGAGMFVVSLRGVNCGFWSHVGCSGLNADIFTRSTKCRWHKSCPNMSLKTCFVVFKFVILLLLTRKCE